MVVCKNCYYKPVLSSFKSRQTDPFHSSLNYRKLVNIEGTDIKGGYFQQDGN